MKSLLLTCILFLSLFGHAQMTKGVISYSLVYTTDSPEMQAAMGMMENSTMTTYFMPKYSRVDLNIGIAMSMQTVTNSKKKKALLLMDMMGKNIAVEGTISEFEEINNQTSTENEITLMEETKLVFGYLCKRAVITKSDGSTLEVWYTDEIAATIEGQQYYDKSVPGFPMQITTTQQGMTVVITVTGIEDEVSKKDFEMKIPEGYEKMKPGELNNQ